jgi:cytoplasmic iron level regulating protein YaaA (DUF328/UPF0246 family)
MKIVISPAKSLDFDSEILINQSSEICFLKEAQAVNKVLKKLKPKELSGLMSISDKLADLNWQRNQERDLEMFTPDNSRQAVYAFNGDVYLGLNVGTLDHNKVAMLQDKLRILSGLYGLVKPLDLIQPYRLEMGTKLPVGKSKNLYEFWKVKVTKALNAELKNEELFINLASNEYFDVIDKKALKVPIITPEFKDYKDGKLKMISFFAKKARGMMVRYIIDTNAETIEDLKGFNYEGYCFDANLSKETTLVFTR